jgi:hypothetical protein
VAVKDVVVADVDSFVVVAAATKTTNDFRGVLATATDGRSCCVKAEASPANTTADARSIKVLPDDRLFCCCCCGWGFVVEIFLL